MIQLLYMTMSKFGLTSGKLNRRVVISRKDGADVASAKERTLPFTIPIVRQAQVFFKKQAAQRDGVGVSDKQEYMFNLRNDVTTNKVNQNCIITYKEEEYSVLNVDKFNEGLVSVTACKRE